MHDEDQGMPTAVADFVEMVRANVASVLGVEPDLTPETLPLVDEYLRRLPGDAPEEVRDLLICSVGAHFGEVTRRLLDGRWAIRGTHPASWRIELIPCFLHFSPYGMAGEVLGGAGSSRFDGAFATSDDQRDELLAMLEQIPPVSEEEYFSLCGRMETLCLVADWLVGRAMNAGQPRRPLGPVDYAGSGGSRRAGP